MNNFRFSGNSLGPSRLTLVSATPAPRRTSKTKIGIIVASVLVTLVVLSVVSFFLFVPKRHVMTWNATPTPWNSTYATDYPIQTTRLATEYPLFTSIRPAVESDMDILYQEMWRNMYDNVDPCDDFYEYACGLHARKNWKREEEENYFTLEYDKIRTKTMEILEGDSLKEKSFSLQYLKRVWDSCVNDASYTRPLLSKLVDYLEELDNLDTWQEKFAMVTRDGFNVFFTIKAEVHYDRWWHEYYFSIDRPELEYNKAHRYNLVTYYSQLIRLLKSRGDGITESDLNLASEILEFEKSMFEKATPTSDRMKRPWDFNNVNYQRQVNEMSGFNWSKIVETVANKSLEMDNFLVRDEDYLKGFADVIKGKNESFISDYIKMSVLRQSCFMLGSECRDIYRDYIEDIDPAKAADLERQTCFDRLGEQMEDLIFQAYLTEWPRESELNARDMFSTLIDQLENEVHNFWWMEENTRSHALEKIKQLQRSLALKHPYSMSIREYESKYADLPSVNSTRSISIFEYYYDLSQHNTRREMSQVGLNVDDPWTISFFSRTPQLIPIGNNLLVPALALQGHFFDDMFPNEIKYGLLGSLMGHAMTHTVDAVAHKYHESIGKPFWSEETKKAFDERMECLVETFEGEDIVIDGNSYGQRVDGENTLDENLADWMGVVMAYEGFRNVTYGGWCMPPNSDYYGPLKKFNREQMFFLSYANVHCSSDTEKSLEDVFSGTTSPRKYRVNMPLRQMDEFAKAFKCKEGTKMNPTKKCIYH